MYNTIYQNFVVNLFFVIFLFITIMMVINFPILRNEAEIGMSLKEIAPVVSEKVLYSGDELVVPFSCNNIITADRWIVHLTATANPDNIGYITIRIDKDEEKTLRTGIFNKISGTYTIPFYNENGKRSFEKIRLHIKLAGGNKREPLFYLAKMKQGENILYQIKIQPEKGEIIDIPKNAIYPRFIKQYKPYGECRNNF